MALNEQLAKRIGALEQQAQKRDVYERHIPYCDLHNSAGQTITTATTTSLTFDTAVSNVGAMYSGAAPDRITIVVAGFYIFTAGVAWATNINGVRDLMIYVNAATNVAFHRHFPGGAQISDHLTVARGIHVDAGDYVRARVYQTSGGDLATARVQYYSPFLSACLQG